MGAYDTPTKKCPYCQIEMEADWVDVGVGMVQCGPYHCENCYASEIGPELQDWCYKDRNGETIYLLSPRKYYSWLNNEKGGKARFVNYSKYVLKYDAPFTEEELNTGFYKRRISPYANTVNGVLVNHIDAKKMYDLGLLDKKDI